MISFDSENIELPTLDYERVRRWIEAVARSHGYDVGRISYLFCDDESMLEANRRYLGHDYYTDIITFDCTRPGRIAGDVIISVDTVASNAAERDLSPVRELQRVIIHGVLHLCGINDKGPGEREIMEAHEDAALLIWDKDEI